MKAWMLIVACALLVGLVCLPMALTPSDPKLIKEALAESVKASRNGQPGGVMDYLSKSLKLNDEDSGDRGEIARYIKHARPDITILNPTPLIDHDRATVVSPVDVTFAFGGSSKPVHLDRVEITLAKESGTRFLIVPAPKWRIIEVKTPETDLAQFAQ